MKHFIFSKETGTWNRRNGSRKLTFNVHQIIKNVPKHIGSVEANSGSYKGDESTVMNYLAEAKLIPVKYRDGYYRGQQTPFSIHKV